MKKPVKILLFAGVGAVAFGTLVVVTTAVIKNGTHEPTLNTPKVNDPTSQEKDNTQKTFSNDPPIYTLNEMVSSGANLWFSTNHLSQEFNKDSFNVTSIYKADDKCFVTYYYLNEANGKSTLQTGKVNLRGAKATDSTLGDNIPEDAQWTTDGKGRSIELEGARMIADMAVDSVECYSPEMTDIITSYVKCMDPNPNNPTTIVLTMSDPKEYTDGQYAGYTGCEAINISKHEDGQTYFVVQKILAETKKLNEYKNLIDFDNSTQAFVTFARTLLESRDTQMTPMQQERFGTLLAPIEEYVQVDYSGEYVITFNNATNNIFNDPNPGM